MKRVVAGLLVVGLFLPLIGCGENKTVIPTNPQPTLKNPPVIGGAGGGGGGASGSKSAD
jgi:hypothetical protein